MKDNTQYRYKQTATRPHHPGVKLTKHDFYENGTQVFFWESLFSNWEPGEFDMLINDDSITFGCSEQAMMFFKAMTFNDFASAKLVMATNSPKEQKAIGRQVKNFDQAVWEKKGLELFPEVLAAKFEQVPGYKAILLGTGDKTLVEASPFDAVWGIKMGVNHPYLIDESKWQGKNLLGICLMKARDLVREG